MPGSQGYHGAENSSSDEMFKAKSHYVANSSGGSGGSGGGGGGGDGY